MRFMKKLDISKNTKKTILELIACENNHIIWCNIWASYNMRFANWCFFPADIANFLWNYWFTDYRIPITLWIPLNLYEHVLRSCSPLSCQPFNLSTLKPLNAWTLKHWNTETFEPWTLNIEHWTSTMPTASYEHQEVSTSDPISPYSLPRPIALSLHRSFSPSPFL